MVIMLCNKTLTIMKRITKLCLLITAIVFAAPKTYAQISIGISITANVAPPALPVYVQPACPTDGYLWVPGYWAYDNDSADYYWVPGVWVAPPNPGLLWTPAYWGYSGGYYGFHSGYWGPHVGFYGGINYGGGYGGVGFGGGQWSGGSFRYNTAVVNVNTTVVHNTYVDRTVIVNNTTHTSFNGPGGVTAKPRPEELAAMKEHHTPPTSQQASHEHTASQDKSQFASVNHGKPAAVAMNKVGGSRFTAQGAKAAPRANTNNANKPKTDAANGGNKPNNADRPNAAPKENKPATDNATHDNAPAKQPQPNQPHAQPKAQPHRQQAQHRPAAKPEEKHE